MQMLEVDPEKRITAQDVLQHPWTHKSEQIRVWRRSPTNTISVYVDLIVLWTVVVPFLSTSYKRYTILAVAN